MPQPGLHEPTEADKPEVFARWKAAGIPDEDLEKLWHLAAIVRKNDRFMDEIGETASEAARKRRFEEFWQGRGLSTHIVRYMAQQKAHRAGAMVMKEQGWGRMTMEMRTMVMAAWMDGLANGIDLNTVPAMFDGIDSSHMRMRD